MLFLQHALACLMLMGFWWIFSKIYNKIFGYMPENTLGKTMKKHKEFNSPKNKTVNGVKIRGTSKD